MGNALYTALLKVLTQRPHEFSSTKVLISMQKTFLGGQLCIELVLMAKLTLYVCCYKKEPI